MKTKSPARKKASKKKGQLIFYVVGAMVAGTAGYFGWQYLKKRRKNAKGSPANNTDIDAILNPIKTGTAAITSESPSTDILLPKPLPKSSNAKSSAADSSDFPLKKGSKGEKVKQFQEALMDKYGKSVLPKYGADGDFGTETINALKKLGLPVTITQSTFNVLVQDNAGSSSSTGQTLFDAANAGDFNKVLTILKKIKNTDDYTSANNVFKMLRLDGGVRQTIVNGLLSTFSGKDQKEKIKYEFLRIGLQFDGKQWSLSGLDGLPIITVIPTTVWINATQGVQVPARMILGNMVSRKSGYTLFQNKGKYFLVHSNCIKFL